MAVSTADLITPHPSPKVTPSPQATQGKAFQWRFYADANTFFASARPGAADKTMASGTDKSVPYEVQGKASAANE